MYVVPQHFELKDLWPWSSSSTAPEVKPECRNYESVIRAEELRTPIDTTVLHEPPSSTDKNVVDLLFHTACVGIPTQPAQNRSVEPRTPNPESPRLRKLKEKLAVTVPGSKAVGTETRFISCPVAASLRVEITQDDKKISSRKPPNHRVKSQKFTKFTIELTRNSVEDILCKWFRNKYDLNQQIIKTPKSSTKSN